MAAGEHEGLAGLSMLLQWKAVAQIMAASADVPV